MSQAERMRTTDVVFGKVHFEPSLFSIDQRTFDLAQLLFSSTIRTVHMTQRGTTKAYWVISDNRVVDSEGEKYAVGRVGRISRRWVRVFDERSFSEAQAEVPRAIVAASHFVLDLNSLNIVFEEVERISAEQFCRVFSAICMQAEPRLGFVSIFPEVEEAAYTEAFNRLKIITSVRIQFVRPNPRNVRLVDVWRQKLLDEPDGAVASIECEAGNRGLKRESDVVQAAASLPTEASEYTAVMVSGWADEERLTKITVSSYETVVRTRAEVPTDSEGVWSRLVRLMRGRRKGM